MIKGTYRFFLDNEEIYKVDNALTTNGRTIAIKSLLGIIPNFAGLIGYGIGDKANTISASTNLISNNCLQFELGRDRVIGSSLDISNNNDILVYTATINDSYQYQIYEVGLFPTNIRNSTSNLVGSLIFDFDRVDLFNKFGTASAASLNQAAESRIGTSLYYLPQTNGSDSYISYASNNGTLTIIQSYASKDTFRLAGLDRNITSASINFRFYSDATNYYDYTFTTPTASGYFISELEVGAAVITGNPSWNTITSSRIWQNNSQSVYLDGLRIDIGSYLVDTSTGMISRAVLPEPIRKPASVPLTIEYSLSLDFNYGIS